MDFKYLPNLPIALAMTRHARERAAKRHISNLDLDFIIAFGRVISNGGATFFFLGKDDIPLEYLKEYAKLEGSTVLVSGKGRIITLYKNKNGSRQIKKKLKWHLGQRARGGSKNAI